MDASTFLAQSSFTDGGVLELINATVERPDIFTQPGELLARLETLNILWGSVFFVVGLLCILNGYKWHKWLIIGCAFLIGIALGGVLSKQMNESRIVMGALGLLCAVIAMPMLRFSVAVMGGLTGALIGANAWTAMGQPAESVLMGAILGFIVLGMAAFILARFVIVLFTSVGGGVLAVLGGITLLMNVPNWDQTVRDSLGANQLVVPLLVGVAAVIGFVRQHAGKEAAAAKPKPAPG